MWCLGEESTRTHIKVKIDFPWGNRLELTFMDSGLTFMDSGLTFMDSGLTFMNSGLTFMDSGLTFMNSGFNYLLSLYTEDEIRDLIPSKKNEKKL